MIQNMQGIESLSSGSWKQQEVAVYVGAVWISPRRVQLTCFRRSQSGPTGRELSLARDQLQARRLGADNLAASEYCCHLSLPNNRWRKHLSSAREDVTCTAFENHYPSYCANYSEVYFQPLLVVLNQDLRAHPLQAYEICQNYQLEEEQPTEAVFLTKIFQVTSHSPKSCNPYHHNQLRRLCCEIGYPLNFRLLGRSFAFLAGLLDILQPAIHSTQLRRKGMFGPLSR